MAKPSMLRFLSTAAKFRIAAPLIAASIVLVPSHATAQSDPFALPKDVDINTARGAERDGPGLSSAMVDGRSINRMVDLRWIGEDLAIGVESAEMAGLPIPEGASGFVKLDDLELAGWKFDRLTQSLSVKLLRKQDGPNNIDVARRNFVAGERSPILAAMVDYSLNASVSRGRAQLGGLVVPRINYGNFDLASAFSYQAGRGEDRANLVRLDTTATIAIPGKAVVARLGDVITAASGSQRPVRIGGVQIGSDFDLRPDLITAPLPEFDGKVAVPTTVDLILNDRRFHTQKVEAGEFKVHNIPMPEGGNEVAVVYRDEFGREVVQSAKLYFSQDMLARGLTEWGANVGFLRRRYGSASNDYRDPVGTFFVRRGLGESLSAGMSGEIGLGVWNAGMQTQVGLSNLALVDAEVRYSHTATQQGMLFHASAQTGGKRISGSLSAYIPTRGYQDIAGIADQSPVSRRFVGAINFNLAGSTRLQLAATNERAFFDEKNPLRALTTSNLRLSGRHQLRKGITLAADIAYRRRERGELAARLGIGIRFGGTKSATATIRRQQDRFSGDLSLYRPDVEPGDIGYAAYGSFSEHGGKRIGAKAAYRAEFARVSAEAEYAGGTVGLRAQADGTLIFADKHLFARRQGNGSYALVRTGDVEGVTVTHENRFAGKTDKGGRLLIPDIRPLVPMQFDIDPDNLPEDAVARSTYRRVEISRRGVALVQMEVEKYRSVLIRVVDGQGRPLAVGVKLVAQPSGREYTVAFDGMIDFNGLSRDTEIGIDSFAGRCAAKIGRLDPESFDLPELELPCTAGNLALSAADGSQSAGVPSL